MAYNYSAKYNKEKMARAVGVSMPISTKQSVEICRMLRGKDLQKSKKMLKDVIEKKKAVPYRRYNQELPHQKGTGPGRFPIKSATYILELLDSVEANAVFKGLDSNSLVVCHINAQKASRPWHYGRFRRRKTKRTHVEIIVTELERGEEVKEGKKPAKREGLKEGRQKEKADNKTGNKAKKLEEKERGGD